MSASSSGNGATGKRETGDSKINHELAPLHSVANFSKFLMLAMIAKLQCCHPTALNCKSILIRFYL